MAAGYSPGRPPNERALLQNVNGDFNWLGVLVSNGTLAVDNATTAIPFYQAPLQPNAAIPTGQFSPSSLVNTLAGKSLILCPTTAGFIATSTLPMVAAGVAPTNGTLVVATTVIAPVAGQQVGLPLVAGERAGSFFMLPSKGWLQWLSTGAGNLHIFEVF